MTSALTRKSFNLSPNQSQTITAATFGIPELTTPASTCVTFFGYLAILSRVVLKYTCLLHQMELETISSTPTPRDAYCRSDEFIAPGQ